MPKIVLVGHGAFGSLYRQRLQDRLDCDLVGVVDNNTSHLPSSVPVHAMTLQHLIDNLDFDTVVISTPSDSHYHIAAQALINNKDVFCAKPGALNLGHFMELQALADKNKRKFYIDYTMLAAPEQNTIDQLFSAFGDPRHMQATRWTSGSARPEGAVYDLVSHDIATFFYHFPEATITSVTCAQDNGIVKARLYNEDDREVCVVSAMYDNVTPNKEVIFHTEIPPFIQHGATIQWDQLDRSLGVSTYIANEPTRIDFRTSPDPITLSFDRFFSGMYEQFVFTRTAAICEMLNESLKKNVAIDAP